MVWEEEKHSGGPPEPRSQAHSAQLPAPSPEGGVAQPSWLRSNALACSSRQLGVPVAPGRPQSAGCQVFAPRRLAETMLFSWFHSVVARRVTVTSPSPVSTAPSANLVFSSSCFVFAYLPIFLHGHRRRALRCFNFKFPGIAAALRPSLKSAALLALPWDRRHSFRHALIPPSRWTAATLPPPRQGGVLS